MCRRPTPPGRSRPMVMWQIAGLVTGQVAHAIVEAQAIHRDGALHLVLQKERHADALTIGHPSSSSSSRSCFIRTILFDSTRCGRGHD
jgi:hypothetical protein